MASGERQTVCVTGGSGFIGSWLLRLLLRRGYTVHATVKNLRKKNSLSLILIYIYIWLISKHFITVSLISIMHQMILLRLSICEPSRERKSTFIFLPSTCSMLIHCVLPSVALWASSTWHPPALSIVFMIPRSPPIISLLYIN